MSALLPVRIATVALAAALASIAAYWALQLLAPRPAIAPVASAETAGPIDPAPAARLFGGAAPARAAAPAPSNLQVLGVIASRGQRAAAILSVDGQPGRAFGVGSALPDQSRVAEVYADRVVLERDGARIDLPAPARGSTAVLTSGPRRGAAGDASGSAAPGTPAFPQTAAPAPPPPLSDGQPTEIYNPPGSLPQIQAPPPSIPGETPGGPVSAAPAGSVPGIAAAPGSLPVGFGPRGMLPPQPQ